MMRVLIRIGLFLLPVSILLPHLGQFAFQPGAEFSDMLISHYPNGIYLQKVLREQGVVPLWSAAILSGYPFAANPLSGLVYPPGWLALFLPLPLGFNLVLVFHLILAGLGMYLLLRQEGLTESAALLGALVFEAMPKIFGHIGAGHLTMIYAVSWTPWLLYVEKKQFFSDRLNWLLPGALLGITALADVRWAAYAGLLWLAFSTREFMTRKTRPSSGWGGWILSRLCSLMMAGLIAAPLLLPLMQYTQLSTRSRMSVQDSMIFSLPPARLLGLIYPNIGGIAEWQLYPGAVTLVLALYVLIYPQLRRAGSFWLGLAAATLVYSLGSLIPFFELVARLPGFSLLRVPSRALLLSGFGFAVLAAIALNGLISGSMREGNTAQSCPAKQRENLVMFAAAVLIGSLAVGMWLVNGQFMLRVQFTWGAIFFVAGGGLIWLAARRLLRAGMLTVFVVSAGLIDLLGVNGLSLDFRPADAVLAQGRETAEFLSAQGPSGSFRVYSPSYSIPQHLAVEYGLELADGVDPLQLAAYAEFMHTATGVPDDGYSVSLPPFASGRPAIDNRDYLPDPEQLGLLNVRYVAAEFPLHHDRLKLVTQYGTTRIYQNLSALPRAWVLSQGEVLNDNIRTDVKILKFANRVVLHAEGPGMLILSEIAYPGWRVSVDGRPGEIETVGGLLRGVYLEEGEHEVLFDFHPFLFYLGLALAGLAWFGLFVLIVIVPRTSRNNLSPSSC